MMNNGGENNANYEKIATTCDLLRILKFMRIVFKYLKYYWQGYESELF